MSKVKFDIFPNERFIDLTMYQFGWESCDPLHSYGPYARNHYLFHYVISGAGTLSSTNSAGITTDYKVKSGQGFLICPKQINTYYADEHYPWEYTWIEFDGVRVKEALELAGLSFDNPIYRSNNKILSNSMKEEMLYISNNASANPLNLIGHLYLFLNYLTESSASQTTLKNGKIRDFYIREALSFIEQNFQNDISIEDIASFCNLNRSYFGKIFKDAVGKSPQEFLITYRMTKAAELLKMTDLTIGDIATAVGYDNQLHFSRAFKNVYELSPKQWRIQNG